MLRTGFWGMNLFGGEKKWNHKGKGNSHTGRRDTKMSEIKEIRSGQ